MPPSFSGGLLCAIAALAATASAAARTPERTRFIKASLSTAASSCSLYFCCLDHAASGGQRQAAARCGSHAVALKSAYFPQSGLISSALAFPLTPTAPSPERG